MSMATGPRSLKERQREEREQLILRAADELLVEKGYHETSIEDIAERVGISKGTVYLHFPSKEDLVVALLERGMRYFICSIDATLASPATRRAKLQAIIEQMYGNVSAQRFRLLGAIHQNPELRNVLAEKGHALAELRDGMAQRIAALLEEGKAAGEFDLTLPTPVMLIAFTSLLLPMGYQRLVVQQHMPLDEVVEHLSRFFFKGIAANEPPEQPEIGRESP
jgi:TetR/AcrR family transcriptional regulator, fatty acid metabolism regulator protein